MAPLSFNNQTVIITSVGHGLGRVYAVFFALAGANVVVHDTDEVRSYLSFFIEEFMVRV
jgi:NAD(P)-dependent dehydrogenase (short-subunit alcohol dehydrogenase family)